MRWHWLSVMLLIVPAAKSEEAFNLLKYIPPQANAVSVVNTANILASPRAVKEGWSKLEHTEYLAGAVPLNPIVERMLIAKDINPDNPGGGTVLAVLSLVKPVDLAKLTTMIHGQQVSIGGDTAVLAPNGTHFFKIDEKLLGAIRTENKQEIGRWMKFVKAAKESQLHKSLNAAVAVSTAHHITLALDTEDLFHATDVERAVAMAKSLQKSPEQQQQINDFFKALRVAVFTAQIKGDGIEARLRFESAHAALKLDPEAAKNFLLETFGRHGALLADMNTAKATISDSRQSVSLTFMVSDEELGHVMSVMLPPASIPGEGIQIAPGEANAQNTLKYFNAVNAITDDLQKQMKKADDYLKTALWHETAVDKIRTLSTIGVDKTIIEYAQGTANRLEAIAGSLRGVPAQVEELGSQAYALGYMPRRGLVGRGGMRMNPWAYGNANIQTNAGEIANKQAQVVKDDEKNRAKIWSEIDGKRSEMRGVIAEKYKVVPPEKK